MQTATNAGMCAVGVSWATDQKKNYGAIHIINSPFNNSFITVQWQRYESTNYRTSNRIKTKSYLHNL
jgi:phosphoglycolate phosphatase-like HAD superfamily hydrolase